MELYCDTCKKKTTFSKTNHVFKKDILMECSACKSLHAVSINTKLGGQ